MEYIIIQIGAGPDAIKTAWDEMIKTVELLLSPEENARFQSHLPKAPIKVAPQTNAEPAGNDVQMH